jgi:pimeloyl-ACP methyl ester carboxylesterase
LLCDRSLWQPQVDALGHVAGCTITDPHMHHATIGKIAEAIVARAPSRFALAGLSMGGYVALEICRKFGEKVDRLALIDTSARADTAVQTDRREKLIALCREGKFKEVVETLYPFLVHPDRLSDSTLRRQVVAMADRVGPDMFIRQQRAIMDRMNQVPNLSKIACPTVVVCGEQDQITPVECSQEMAASIKDSQLAIIANCGHMSTMEKPDEVSRLLHHWLTRI